MRESTGEVNKHHTTHTNHSTHAKKVPKLTIPSPQDATEVSSPRGQIQANIHVLCSQSAPQLHTEQDFERIHAIHDAKRALNARTDIIYYITADELIRVVNDADIHHLRLCAIHPDDTTPEGASVISPHRKLSKSPARSKSPKLSAQVPTPAGILTPRREHSRRSLSVDTYTAIPAAIPAKITPPIPRSSITSSDSVCGGRERRGSADGRVKFRTSTRDVDMGGGMGRELSVIQVTYSLSTKAYQYFVLDIITTDGPRVGGYTLRGLADKEMRGDIIVFFECRVVTNPNTHIDILVYSPDIKKVEMPIYLQLSGDNITTEHAVDMLANVIAAAREDADGLGDTNTRVRTI